MAIATLCYIVMSKSGTRKNIKLQTASLEEIDEITKSKHNAYELINDKRYKPIIDQIGDYAKGNLAIIYSVEKENKMILPVLYNTDNIVLRSSISGEESEVDKARKLLLSSKNNLYLKLFLNSPNFILTTMHMIRLDPNEYVFAKKRGLNPTLINDEYRLSIKDILNYRVNNNKLKEFRPLFEDTLEVWKSDLYDLDDEELYFYSRSLKILSETYKRKMQEKEVIKNFKFDHKTLSNVLKSKYKLSTLKKGNTLNRVYTKVRKLEEV